MSVLAIDPGHSYSAVVGLNGDRIRKHAIMLNEELLGFLLDETTQLAYGYLAVEMVASYGMAVGKDVFETVYWIGRFCQAWGGAHKRIYRKDVKMHLCQDPRAKDGNIIQALVDRFAYGQPNRGKGTKKAPGPFYGFRGDEWQAMAVGVYFQDTMKF